MRDDYDRWPDLRQSILRYAEFGMVAEAIVQADACPKCSELRGKVFEPHKAPPIPVMGCTNANCRCDYAPR
ncbi:MAG TPA: hypothetical protein VMM78_04475 [Thermomicrobiales bacterium]|nr:hypothetical protein [Thermomicrobiales bacterium]